jgi:hypothetical protein
MSNYHRFTDTEKWCPICQLWKVHSFFGKNKSNTPLGLSSICKECKNSLGKKRNRRRSVTEDPPQSKSVRDRKRLYRQKLRKSVLSFLGNRCSNSECLVVNEDGTRGCVDSRCLQIDHVNGDGSKERKQFHGHMASFYLKVLADTTGCYQLLCANCNWIKRSINKEV